jgi:hypothetical protein
LLPGDFIPDPPITPNPNKDSNLRVITAPKPINPKQGILDIGINKQIEIDGIGMGVLSDSLYWLVV